MANLQHNHDDEDDCDILELRLAALSSLVSKPKKKKKLAEDAIHMSPSFNHEHQFLPVMHEHQMPINGMSMNYPAQRPGFLNQVTPPRQPIFNPGYHHQPMIPQPPFIQHPQAFPPRHPMMPVIQPHLNPNFIAPNPHVSRFIPVAPELGLLELKESMPLPHDLNGTTFEPTPPSRLSPRSAQFVAENNKALQRRRSFTPGRSRSRSPYAYRYSRSRSRSPQYKPIISHISRKRTRSKSPNNYIRKSRSPRNRSPIKRPSPKYSENERNKRRPFKYSGNANSRDRQGRQELDRRAARTPPKPSAKDKTENGSNDNKKVEKPREKSPSPVKSTKEVAVKEKREKTEQELEDELLASSDSEEESMKVDEDEIKMTLDEKDLDFLDDDEEESENEGRFKSKASTATEQKKPATSSFKSSYPPRAYDKPRSYGNEKNNSQRGEFRRYKYNDKDNSKRDRKRSRSPLDSDRRTKDEKRHESPIRKKKSPEARKSPEIVQKSTKEAAKPSKIIVTTANRDKQEAVKDEPRKVKVALPLFKATFKSVEQPVDEKKKDEEAKKDERAPDRIRLVRASVVSKVDPVKVEKPTKTKEVEGKRPTPAILKRLGGFIKDPGQKAARAWAREQIVQIVCENLLRELRKNYERRAVGLPAV